MQAVKAVYKEGNIQLLTPLVGVNEADLFVIVLDKDDKTSGESLFLSKDFPCSQLGNPQKYRDKLDCYASPSRPGHSIATQQGDGSHALQ